MGEADRLFRTAGFPSVIDSDHSVGVLMWNLISHFLTFAGGMASGVMLMCLMQTGKLADKEFETMKEE